MLDNLCKNIKWGKKASPINILNAPLLETSYDDLRQTDTDEHTREIMEDDVNIKLDIVY